ncbi:serine hydrolase domain-containing protein [Arthrobacter sp. JSM 101049]|uniref:serine hydrolase domain-containing protein n=1 Tax=Arthrobacter sp. JSM 101049 TaxID=929097 RepID=UPI003567C172
MSTPTPHEASNDAGLAAEDFERLQEVFARHLASSGGGMSFCVYRDGKPLARFHGGTTVRRGGPPAPGLPAARPWTGATRAVLFSGTKGLVATLAAILAGRGQLDVRRPVADYWPEFAAAGKDDVPVSCLLSHGLGLVYVDPEPDGKGAYYDNRLNASILAGQRPLWAPGTRVAYHAITYGYLMSELLLRITGQEVGELLRELVAEPLGLDLHLGLPAELDEELATIFRADGYAISTFLTDPERRRIVDRMYAGSLSGDGDAFNSVAMRRGQLAAGGAIGTAESMAALYSHLVAPGQQLVSPTALADATTTWSEGVDAVNDRPLRFGLGYELADPLGTYGPVVPAFGHSGAGGGLHGAWPGKNIGFSFLTNEMVAEDRDRRAKDLLGVLAHLV